MKFPGKDAVIFPQWVGDSWCDEIYRIEQIVIFCPLWLFCVHFFPLFPQNSATGAIQNTKLKSEQVWHKSCISGCKTLTESRNIRDKDPWIYYYYYIYIYFFTVMEEK